MRLFETSAARPATFRRGFALLFVPLALLALPLVFHTSPQPAAFGYSGPYLVLLGGAAGLVVLVPALAGRRCRRRGSMRPAGRLLVLAGAACVAALGLEAALHLCFSDAFATYRKWGQRRSTLYTYVTRPSHAWAAFGGHYSTDGHGFRTHLQDRHWDETWRGLRRGGESRLVVVIGGSSAFGFGLDDDATWPHLLEQELASFEPRTMVVNAGNNGHASLQVALRLYLEVLPQAPTHVLFYGSVNDVWEHGTDVDKIHVQEEIALAPSEAAYLWRKHRGQNLYARTLVAHLLRRGLRRLFPPAPAPPATALDAAERARIAENARRFGRNLRAMADMCRRAGTTLVLTTFLFDGPRVPLYARTALRRHNEVLRDVARTEKLPLVDLYAAFDREVGDPEGFFFGDHYHPAWGGARFLAEHCARALAPILRAAR